MKKETKVLTVDTTIGELICAIADAASETTNTNDDLEAMTKLVLLELLRKREQAEL